ncbi:MAG: hypothetical protein JXA37_06580 [Chloroflexia bacterium]|nr:hypothetical protein [Chloroflexia bacterium]
MGIRDRTYQGELHRLSLVLKAQDGESVALEVTAFLPRLRPGETWNLPPFLGLRGCLERLRFAVDPASDTFYFGALSGDDE